MSAGITKLLTAEEFFDFVHRPENRDRCFELERGEVVEMSRPGRRHGFVCANVTRILGNYTFAKRKGYVCSNDTGVIVDRDPDTVRGPDVALFDDVRSYGELPIKYTDALPRLAVEVFSPEDRMSKVQRRIGQFLSRGVLLVWLVDPDERTVTVYKPNDFPRVLDESDELTGNDVVADFRCRVADIFFIPTDAPPSA
jgi:Uma2 family endonuclease